jgi:hypothetical protein
MTRNDHFEQIKTGDIKTGPSGALLPHLRFGTPSVTMQGLVPNNAILDFDLKPGSVSLLSDSMTSKS